MRPKNSVTTPHIQNCTRVVSRRSGRKYFRGGISLMQALHLWSRTWIGFTDLVRNRRQFKNSKYEYRSTKQITNQEKPNDRNGRQVSLCTPFVLNFEHADL
jgi:hypothetical protein